MEGWSWWDLGLWAAFGYVAVLTLVRLMIARRDMLLTDLRHQVGARKRSRGKQGKGESSE